MKEFVARMDEDRLVGIENCLQWSFFRRQFVHH